VLPPGSQIGPITPEQRKELMASSLVAGVYEKVVDRESAYEKLKGRAVQSADAGDALRETAGQAGSAAAQEAGGGLMDSLSGLLFGTTGPRGAKHDGLAQTMAKSAVRSVGSAVGREIIRGVLGGLLGGGGTRSRRR
jgi:hypothetical protein